MKTLVTIAVLCAISVPAHATANLSWSTDPAKPCLVFGSNNSKSSIKFCPNGDTFRRPSPTDAWVKQTYSCAYIKNAKENWSEIFCNNGHRWRNTAGVVQHFTPPKPTYVPVPSGGRLSDLEDRIDDLESRLGDLE